MALCCILDMKVIMLMLKRSRVLLFLATLIFCVPLFSIFIVPKAYAASGKWVDAAHIDVDGTIYIDSKTGDSMDYTVGGNSGCVNQIKGFNKNWGEGGTNYGEAKLIKKTKDPLSGKCEEKEEKITLSNTADATALFHWVDAGTIESAFLKYEQTIRFGNNQIASKRVSLPTGSYKTLEGRNNVFAQQTNEDSKSSITVKGNTSGDFIYREDGAEGEPLGVRIASEKKREIPAGQGTPVAGGGTTTLDDPGPSCESEGGVLSWILCPLLFLGDAVVRWLDERISNVLSVPDDYLAPGGDVELGWRRLRTIAYSLLIPIMLVMVISTALGFEFISAYTVKKALPRLFIAAIFIALSFEVCKFLIVLTNNVGGGIGNIIMGVFTNADGVGASEVSMAQIFSPDGGDSTVALTGLIIGGGVALAIGSIGILLSYMLVAVIGLAMGFFLLSFRQMLLVALVLLAPLAILAWIFPGNDKLWKLWWGTFSKLLLLYPLIMILIASGKSFATLVQTTADGNLVNTLLKLVAYVGPYFFIPAAFKFAGGIFGNVAGMANDRSRGLFDRQKKYRGRKMGENYQKTRNYSRFSDRNALTRGLNKTLGAGFNPRDVARGTEGIRAGRRTGLSAQGHDTWKNDATIQANQGDDAFLLGLVSEDMAENKIAQAAVKRDQAREAMQAAQTAGDQPAFEEARNKMLGAQAEVDARTSALGAARRVNSRKSDSTRIQALQALAKTGYQFSPGEAGYEEVADLASTFARGDQGMYSSLMNEAQYNFKGAGRAEFGGINHGASLDIKSGVRKLTNAQRGQGKTDQYYGAASAWMGAGAVDESGKTHASAAQMAISMKDSPPSDADISQYHSMLLNDHMYATDANKIEIEKQLQAMELYAAGGPMHGPADPKGTPELLGPPEPPSDLAIKLAQNRQAMSRNNNQNDPRITGDT